MNCVSDAYVKILQVSHMISVHGVLQVSALKPFELIAWDDLLELSSLQALTHRHSSLVMVWQNVLWLLALLHYILALALISWMLMNYPTIEQL